MKFRDDIDIDNTWIVSDTHFGHDNIVGFCHRPEDHEQVMIAEWRKEVPDTSETTLLHLGDLSYRGNARFKNLIARELTPRTARVGKIVPGARKLLIQGNHDRQRFSFYKDSGFQIVKPFQIAVNIEENCRAATPEEIEADEFWLDHGWRTVSFSHYPWNNDEDGLMPYGHTRVHGHIHNNGYSRDAFVPFVRDHINLSAEQTKYKPVNLGILLRACLLGRYPETTQEQLDKARDRKAGIR